MRLSPAKVRQRASRDTSLRTHPRRRGLIDVVLVEFGIDLGDDDAVVLGCPVDGDVAVDDVLEHLGTGAFERISQNPESGSTLTTYGASFWLHADQA